jgi:hypothetical protein
MPWKSLIAGMQKIVGLPGPNGLIIDHGRMVEFRSLMQRTGLMRMRSKDIADGFLTVIPGKQRKGKGVYYTPGQVVEYILDQSLPHPRFGKKVADPYPDGFRLLEPACGAGYFLLAAFNRFRDNYRKAGISDKVAIRTILTDRIAAVDIDGDALLVALACLLQESGDEIYNALDDGPITLPLFRADFLDKHYDRPTTALGKLIIEGFPAIVGNPPYVSFYSKRAKAISVGEREYFKANYLMGSGRINTYCLFIERAFDLLSPSGTLGFIVPNTVLIMKSYEPLRNYLLENGWLKNIVDLSMKVFPEVEVPTCVLAVERKDPRAIQFPRKAQTGFWESARVGTSIAFEETDQADFAKLPWSMFNIHIRSGDHDTLKAIESVGVPLGKDFEVRDGINPANMTDKLVTSSPDDLPLPYKMVLRGKDISPYQLSWDNLWVRYDSELVDKSLGEYCFLREERIFTSKPKILTRQTADRIVGALDDSGFYALNTLHVTIPLNGGMNLKCLLALYNSSLLNYYYRLVFPDTERVFPQVKTVNLEKLPLPKINGESTRLMQLVDMLQPKSGAKPSSLSVVNQEKVLDEIDNIVYRLYGLAPEHVARIEHSPYTSSIRHNRR